MNILIDLETAEVIWADTEKLKIGLEIGADCLCEYNEKMLQKLADSIKEHGVFKPLIVTRKGDRYEIREGNRRFLASKIAGLEKMAAIVVNME